MRHFGVRGSAGLRDTATTVLVVVLGLSGIGCGGGGDDGKAAPRKRCEPTADDLMAEALAYERALMIRGREDAGFDEAFGDESEALFDEADLQRHELIEQAAADLGIEPPDLAAESNCRVTTAGVEREALSANVQLAFGVTARALADAARSVPYSGAMESMPYMTATTGNAADGSPKTIVTTFNTQTAGADSRVTVTTTMNTEVTTGAGTATESASVAATIDVCPDPGGLARGNVVVVLDGAAVDGSSYHANSSQNFDFVVNDQAEVVSTEIASSITYRASGAREADVAARAEGSFSGDSNHFDGGSVTTERSDGSPESQALVERNLMSFGLSTASLVRPEARAKWRGGVCVEVLTEPQSEMVEANAELEVTATPRHKFDGSNVDANVVATLSGVKSLDKQGQRVPPPATYHYVAGSKFRDQGVIKFKSTSKRGIGEGTSTITVKCDEDMMCPEGKVLNVETCECECTEVMECPSGQVWDDEACECVCEPEPCAAGERWDTSRCECVCDLSCPPGQTLNPDTCECEASCNIDPMFGNLSPDCAWIGTITITGNDGGQVEDPNPVEDVTWTWSANYDASLNVRDEGTGVMTLDGSVSGNWQLVQTTVVGPECTLTQTENASVSTGLSGSGTAFVSASGDGNLQLGLLLPAEASLTGMTTLEGTGGDCTGGEPSDLVKDVSSFAGSAEPSASTFSGSVDIEQVYLYVPNYGYVSFQMSWSLRLVRR